MWIEALLPERAWYHIQIMSIPLVVHCALVPPNISSTHLVCQAELVGRGGGSRGPLWPVHSTQLVRLKLCSPRKRALRRAVADQRSGRQAGGESTVGREGVIAVTSAWGDGGAALRGGRYSYDQPLACA
ncbi:MAG: hypothetical protein SGPRY_007395, partial [Prymnesium sp.]